MGRQSGQPPRTAARHATRAKQPEPKEPGPRPQSTRNHRGGRTRDRSQTARSGESPRRGLEVQIQGGREVGHGPAGACLPCAASPYHQRDARVQPVENDFSRGNVAFARDGFTEREQNGQRVGVRSPIGAPHDRGVGYVLTEECGGHSVPSSPPPVGASFQGVRRTNGHIQRRVGIAQGRGEDISGSQVRAGDEPRYLHLRGVIAL